MRDASELSLVVFLLLPLSQECLCLKVEADKNLVEELARAEEGHQLSKEQFVFVLNLLVDVEGTQDVLGV